MSTRSFNEVSGSSGKRPQSAHWTLCVTTVSVFFLVLAGMQIVLSGVSEGYCYVWPDIGTHFTRGYSHIGFARVQPGMTQKQVIDLIGAPLSSGYGKPGPSGWPQWQRGDLTWSYSQDSSALGGDWAWLSREVVFRDGVVVQKVKWTYHD